MQNRLKIGRWSTAEDEYIRENCKIPSDCKSVGRHLNRSALSVLMRYKKLNVDNPYTKQVADNLNYEVDRENSEAGKVGLSGLTKAIKLSFPASFLSAEADTIAKTLMALCSGIGANRCLDVSVMVRVR